VAAYLTYRAVRRPVRRPLAAAHRMGV
jgi:hypothetical protein